MTDDQGVHQVVPGVAMTPLTLAELRLKHAQLAERAERLRQEQRCALATSPRALSLSKEVRLLQERADDYAGLLKQAEEGR